MKSTFAKQGFMPLLTALLLFVAFLFSTTSASAQAVDGDKNLNWMLEGQALVVLENEVSLWAAGQALGNYGQPGAPAWINADNHIQYYKLIMDAIEKGSSVYAAVGEMLGQVPNNAGGGTSLSTELKLNSVLLSLKKDATDLLTN